MPEPDDQQQDDYAEGRSGESLSLPPEGTRNKRPMNPLRLSFQVGAVFAIVGLCGIGVIGMTGRSRDAAYRMRSTNNLKQIGLGIHNYLDTNGELPSNSCGPDGKPLLSWRVHILPYIEQDNLYRQFRLDEPWDSPNNVRLLNRIPMTYDDRLGKAPPGMTFYRGFSSPGAVFDRLLRLDQPRPEK